MTEQEKQNESNVQTLNKINTAAASVQNASKAVAKAGAGNLAGAVLDIIQDENFRKAIIAVIALLAFLFVGITMLVGTAITGTVESIYSGYLENWNENWEEQGIASNGSLLYLYGTGTETAQQQALLDTIRDLLFPTSDQADNSDLGDSSSLTSVDDGDYRTMLNSITSLEALAGEDGALRQRLDMIKGRVEQRGVQFETFANAQYEWEAAGIALATVLAEAYKNPILFAGVNLFKCSVDINMDAFKITDLQALKILAAYSIQKDCLLGDIDMWDLMDYCGWYGLEMGEVQPIYDDSIYTISYSQVFGSEIGGVVEEGQLLTKQVEHLSAPTLPVWTGSCAPQWYYEELAQITESNKRYDQLEASGKTEALAELTRYETDANGQIVLSNFEKLSNYQTFGIIDRLYSATTATLTISRSEYTGIDEVPREFIDSLTGTLRGMWDEAYSTQTKYTSYGTKVTRDAENNHSVTIYTSNTHYYYIVNNTTGWTSKKYQGTAGGSITIGNLVANTTYTVYETWTEKSNNPVRPVTPITPTDSADSEAQPMSLVTKTYIEEIDKFKTFPPAAEHEAYQLYFALNVSYAARSVEDIIIDLLGLWPGSLADTETGSDGREYAGGYSDNELLARTWTDTYTDSSGKVTAVDFERQQPYQTAAYEDIILAIADLLAIDTAGLFEPEYGYGETIVEMAMKEYEYYHANNLSGGARYWEMVREGLGWTVSPDTAWCACFVMTTAWQCGFVGEGKAWGEMICEIGGWPFYCPYLWSELVESGGTPHSDTTEGYKPVPGDIVFFGGYVPGSRLVHVGIVKEVLEDGTLVTIEGNWGNAVSINYYEEGYDVGTYVYYSPNAGYNIYIWGYITPVYPSTFQENPLYENIYSVVAPTVTARTLGSGEGSAFVTGVTRFRWSQLDAVLTCLQESYPAMYRDAMRTAYDAGDISAFTSVWNLVANTYSDDFRAAQQIIATKLFLRPLASEVKSKTGFDWTATTAREELFLAIATTTDQQSVVQEILTLLCSDLRNNTTDQEFLELMTEDNMLRTMISANRSILWPTDSEALRSDWISSIGAVLEELCRLAEETETETGGT